ncbi:MAG TPA: glutaredoxin domain-containing protein [Candidatus Bilamarchaeaceae archaeon]|nr:glutaredoxin domain-containing protein [Candidatus Bilamarchaeaceae archaeon]
MVTSYLLFTTPTCPSCPPLKKLLSELEVKGALKGENIDVTSNGGYEKAMEFHVNRAPTVVLFDENKNEVGRAHNVHEIKSIVYDY